ncbi:MAG: hypothetical protein RR092_04875 [Oscillospiraceae bacterium]
MKLEKRSEGGDPVLEDADETKTPGISHQKPVFIYIVILFTVAFALILLSFFMHQRSNEQVLGEMKTNLNALGELQEALDENVALQKQLTDTEKQAAAMENDLKRAQAETKKAQDEARALRLLYTAGQQYAAGDKDDARATLALLDSEGLTATLPTDSKDGVVSPMERFGQLKDALA